MKAQQMEINYQPAQKRLAAGKSPLLNAHFRLPKSAKRLVARELGRAQRETQKRLAIEAQLGFMSKNAVREKAKEQLH